MYPFLLTGMVNTSEKQTTNVHIITNVHIMCQYIKGKSDLKRLRGEQYLLGTKETNANGESGRLRSIKYLTARQHPKWNSWV